MAENATTCAPRTSTTATGLGAVLLVGHSEPDGRLLCKALAQVGTHISTDFRMGADEVLDLLLSSRPKGIPPRLILIDAESADGVGLLRKLKSIPDTVSLPVIAMLESDNAAATRDMYAQGANACVVMPVSFTEAVQLAEVIVRFWMQTACVAPH